MQAVVVSDAPPPQPIAHSQCALCAGAAAGLIAGVDHAQRVDHLDLEEGRPEGCHLILILHGRRERTDLVRAHIQLLGRVTGDPRPSVIRGIHEPRDWQDRGYHTLLGVSASQRQTEHRSPVIVPGSFLIFGDERGTTRRFSVLPIAHIIQYQIPSQ